ncbi:hypothetical protein [Phycisphaera mikurensis]|uniref:Uncharacterized protein n=1 Tax=Phycisphaera mikurensis (strain NBRC 102666 / KCTC 22515 / FYK2301M01) TaxID=1142394 RepID=I0IAI3_PHYMF|nr:hypothetical protein [Phycisphaera mikurensis]MBB6441732.1 hypothetical protein [Phycisphaera mikurensis]BAM02271.1 hypothetical protein PSMK_01120 [Phycisphaera mikurensis NBRC 102666]
MRSPRNAVLLATLCVPLLLPSSGCEVIKSKVPGMNPAEKLPPAELRVGGGRQIDFLAPGPGTLMYANAHTGETLKTQSVAAGERVTFTVDLSNPDDPLLFGADPSSFEGVLYFRPEGYVPPAASEPAPDGAI